MDCKEASYEHTTNQDFDICYLTYFCYEREYFHIFTLALINSKSYQYTNDLMKTLQHIWEMFLFHFTSKTEKYVLPLTCAGAITFDG